MDRDVRAFLDTTAHDLRRLLLFHLLFHHLLACVDPGPNGFDPNTLSLLYAFSIRLHCLLLGGRLSIDIIDTHETQRLLLFSLRSLKARKPT